MIGSDRGRFVWWHSLSLAVTQSRSPRPVPCGFDGRGAPGMEHHANAMSQGTGAVRSVSEEDGERQR